MRKFVVFDNNGGWASEIESESLEALLKTITEDVEGQFDWSNGDAVKVGEVVFDGTICLGVVTNNVVPKPVVEEEIEIHKGFDCSEVYEVPLFPIGTILKSKINQPLGSHLELGDLAVVTTLNKRGNCRAKKLNSLASSSSLPSPDYFEFLYGTSYPFFVFQNTWDVVYVPVWPDVSAPIENLGGLVNGTILKALVDSPMSISSMSRGDIGVVESKDSIRLLQSESGRGIYLYGNEKTTMEMFDKTWEIIYVPK